MLCGLLVMFGVMGWLGLSFNLFNVIAAILIIGLGVDYGIFMVNRCQYGSGMHTDKAVLVSALTTLAGFGSLALARHPAMSSMGLTVLFGISAAVVTALLVVPSVYCPLVSARGSKGRVVKRCCLLVLLLCVALTACGRPTLPPHSTTIVDGLTRQQLLARHWLSGTNRYLCRQSGVLKLRWREFPLQGVLRIDSTVHEARLVAMDSMGVKLFDLSVTDQDMTLNYLLPLLEEHPQLPKVVADSVRRIFLTPQPQPEDQLQSRCSGQPYQLVGDAASGLFLRLAGRRSACRRFVWIRTMKTGG